MVQPGKGNSGLQMDKSIINGDDWQQARQISELRTRKTLGGQVKKKLAVIREHTSTEGNSISSENSFAVASTDSEIHLAEKNALNKPGSLENAAPEVQDEIPPLNSLNLMSWQTEESEEEVCSVIKSTRKKKKRKSARNANNKRCQVRDQETQPAVGTPDSEGEESKVRPRFNLRDRRPIKKLHK